MLTIKIKNKFLAEDINYRAEKIRVAPEFVRSYYKWSLPFNRSFCRKCFNFVKKNKNDIIWVDNNITHDTMGAEILFFRDFWTVLVSLKDICKNAMESLLESGRNIITDARMLAHGIFHELLHAETFDASYEGIIDRSN